MRDIHLPFPAASQLVAEPVYECMVCRDRGWRRKNSGENRMTRCECRSPSENPRLVKLAMASAGMQSDEIQSAFSPWDASHQAEPSWARAWLEAAMVGDPIEGARSPWALALLGQPGRGKTKTAAVLVRIFLQIGGQRPLWVRIPEGYDRVQAERRSDACLQESSLEAQIEHAGLAVFDDFGISHRANPERMEATVCEWLCRRHRRHALSIITSNAEDLAAIGAPRLESRIAEGVYRIMVAPTDYRDSHPPAAGEVLR